jgi:hypothetical protein
VTLAAAMLLAACGERTSGPVPQRPAATPGVRISMDELHRAGGVPPRWRFTPAPGDPVAGRHAFLQLGCHTCHVVREPGGPVATADGVGPELTGMGSHHPPEYFVEAIVNPDAVLVDAPGYVGPDGRSVMPAYPDMTLGQLADVVAYLSSLKSDDPHAHHAHHQHAAPGTPPAVASFGPRPVPPPHDGKVFLVQIYDVNPGQLEQLERWFTQEGRAGFLAFDGLLSVETWVDNTRQGPALVSTWAFRDEAALARFMADAKVASVGGKFDAFIGPHDHLVFRNPPVYRAATLSAP